MIKAYNETPENFGSPSDKTVNEMIRLVEHQITLDEHNEKNQIDENRKSEEYKSHGSTQKWHSPTKKN